MAKRARGSSPKYCEALPSNRLAIQAARISSSSGVLAWNCGSLAQKLEERGKIALEAGLLHGAQHLLVQARDFRFAERMDGRRILIEGGEFPDLGPIVGLAVRQIVGGQRGARARDIFAAKEFQQFPIRRLHGIADRTDGLDRADVF